MIQLSIYWVPTVGEPVLSGGGTQAVSALEESA